MEATGITPAEKMASSASRRFDGASTASCKLMRAAACFGIAPPASRRKWRARRLARPPCVSRCKSCRRPDEDAMIRLNRKT